jgi:hypothetical protein
VKRGGWHMRTLGESILDEFGKLGPSAAMVEIVAVWPDAVGEAIAENAWPARLTRDGTLVVHASSSVWAFELTQLAGDIRARLGEALGDSVPKALSFVPGRLPERGTAEPAGAGQAPPPEVSDAQRAEGERLASGIGDEELRAVVARAAAASLARGSSRPDDRSL